MFYIKHGSENFTVIDCYLKEGYDNNCRLDEIIAEIEQESRGRVCRFISTHPDNDHILGIDRLDDKWEILNFYAVANNIPEDRCDDSLTRYLWLKENRNFEIKQGIKRAFLNEHGEKVKSSGITFLWPYLDNQKYKDALKAVSEGEKGKCVNNISPIIKYSIENGPTFIWMGDMETDMQQEYYNYCVENGISIPKCDIFFQPHHGRKTGKTPLELLESINPRIVVIGNAPSDMIEYGDANKTITQNTAGDILFHVDGKKIHVYTQNYVNNLPECLKNDCTMPSHPNFFYGGTLAID